jgi:hypothetical protein
MCCAGCDAPQVFSYVDDVFLPKVARIDAVIAETGESGFQGQLSVRAVL